MLTRLTLLVSLALATGCRVKGPVGDQIANVGPTHEPVLVAETTREVMTKRAPDVLVARDGSSCRVGPDAYAHTAVGARFRCPWTTTSGAPGA
jgi:hypothetical protein